MAKRVAVIDIGSNSVRMVVYERTSRFAFHLLHEAKSRVRISEDAYKNSDNLQEVPMQRTFNALKEFLSISSSFKVRKTLCVATSALRDAPNKKEFLGRVQKELKLNIKVIDGTKESYLGAIACANLLPEQKNALSIDIGGGSTEFAIIDSKDVKNTISLNLGTVRLKELFFDKNRVDEAIEYIDSELEALENIDASTLIGMGGTFRAISNAIMSTNNYPLNKLHAYEYSCLEFSEFISKVLKADETELKKLGIKKDRFDVIKPGALILQRVVKKVNVQKLLTSGVGVREGLYLSDLLRNSKDKFPHNYNTSIRYLLDSHLLDSSFSNQLNSLSKKLFDATRKYLGLDIKYRRDLSIAAKLYPTGNSVHFYSKHKHSYYLIQNALEYGFTHQQIMLIATLVRYAKRKLPSSEHINKYTILLPNKSTLNALSYLLSLTIALLSHKPRNIDFDIKFSDGILKIESKNTLYLSQEAVEKLDSIKDFKVKF
ncbi:MAG: Ppx/GppA family phosphatase [Sulfurimonas sp.]|nr:Ppx/GppA family phosphatase [Sulfurimonas sp.]